MADKEKKAKKGLSHRIIALEKEVFGERDFGGLDERMVKLEEKVSGEESSGGMKQRVIALEDAVDEDLNPVIRADGGA